MATPFSKSLASVHAEQSSKKSLWLILASTLLLLWFLWFFRVPVAVYSLSEAARLEVHTDIHPIHAPIIGRIEKVNVTLGEVVDKGDVLLTLDSERLAIRLREAKDLLNASQAEAEALVQHIQTISSGGESESSEVQAELLSAQASVEEAKLALAHAEDRLQRMRSLHDSGNVSDVELNDAKNTFEKLAAAHQAALSSLKKIEQAGATRKADRAARISELQTDLARLERERVEIQALIKQLEYEISQHVIRAPLDGRIGEIADLYVGMQVKEGERLGVFVPEGDLQVEAFFSPGEALGHLKKGQQGRIMFEGFPWTQYGSGRVTITNIAEEIRNGLVEVKLSVSLAADSAIPLQHGMPASVEIEIEKVLPVELVLRAAGKIVRKH